MNKTLRTWIAGAALAGSVLTLGMGAASAQTATPASTPAAQTGTARPQNGGFSAHAPAIAKALGMTTDELATARAAGKTIAQLATEKGVDLQKIIATYVAEEQAEHPDMAPADVLKRVTDSVNNVKPAGGGRTRGPKPTATTVVKAA